MTKTNQKSSAMADYLRLARPHLIMRMDPVSYREFKLTPYTSEVEPSQDEIIDEGYKPDDLSPLGPVYWRIVRRGDEQFYCSTYLATRDQVIRGWGTSGLAYCDPITGLAVARIETYAGVSCPSSVDTKGETGSEAA